MRYDSFTYSLFKKKILTLLKSWDNYDCDMFQVLGKNSLVSFETLKSLHSVKYKKRCYIFVEQQDIYITTYCISELLVYRVSNMYSRYSISSVCNSVHLGNSVLFLFPTLLVILVKGVFISLHIIRVIVWYFSTVYVRIKDLEYVISFGVEYFIAKIEVEVEPLVENESNKSQHIYINVHVYIYIVN